jgi:hypothetical protein
MSLDMTKSPAFVPSLSKADAVALIVLLALATALWLPRFQGPIDLRWDGGVYYVLGTSLAEGKGYRLLNEPGEIKAVQYPPLLPALIAAHQVVLKTNDPTVVGQQLRLSSFFMFVIYILAVYVLARRYFALGLALLLTLICLFNFELHFLSDLCFPEVAFALATVLFVLTHDRSGKVLAIISATLAVAAYGLRTAGVCLLAAWVFEGLSNKDFKNAALRLALMLTIVIGWQSYIRSVENEPIYRNPAYAYQRADYLFYNVSYLRNAFLKEPYAKSDPASMVDLAARSLRQLAESPMRLGVAVTSDRSAWDDQRSIVNRRLGFNLIPRWMINVVLVPLGLLILAGVALQFARRQWIIPFYLLLSLALFSLTPWPEQFTRYFMPLTPFVALPLFLVLESLNNYLRRVWPEKGRFGVILSGSLVSVILFQNGLTVAMMYRRIHQDVNYVDRNGTTVTYRLFFYTSNYRELDRGLDWLRQVAEPDDVIAFSMPHWVYLRTGRKAIMPPFETDPAAAQKLLDTAPVTFLIQGRGFPLETRHYVAPVVETFPELWKLAYSERRLQIYQRVGLPTAAGSQDLVRP